MADRPQLDPRAPLSDERFVEIYRAHRSAITRYLRRRLGDDAAEDAAAEVFFRAFRRIGDFDTSRGDGSALPWLYGFASNVVLERGRAERRRLRLIERLAQEHGRGSRAGSVDDADAGDDATLDPRLVAGLQALSAGDRETPLLLAWGELSYDETATALDIPVGTVRSRVNRARRKLAAAGVAAEGPRITPTWKPTAPSRNPSGGPEASMPERNDTDLFAALGRQADAGLGDPSVQASIERNLDARLAAGAPSRRRRIRAWIAGHTAVVIAIGAVSVAGAGATAAVVLHGTPSHPAHGVIPRVPGEHRVRERTYSIEMTPQLTVGEVGWCSTMATRFDDGQFGGSGAGCGPVGGERRHVHAGGTMYLGKGRGLLAYAIVDRSVAYAITATKPPRQLVPVADAGLPNGWRVIVQLPGESHTGNLRFRDAGGQRISTRLGPADFSAPQPQAGSAGMTPADVPCAITLPTDAVARGSRWVSEFVERDHLPGKALLPCALTRVKVGDEWAEALVLVDAARPGDDAAMDLPATRPSRKPNRVDFTPVAMHDFRPDPRLPRMPVGIPMGADATATRVGEGWLVVRAKRAALRDELLDQVRVRVRN